MKRKYDPDDILPIIADYFFQHGEEVDLSLPFEKVYSNIVDFAENYYSDVDMPKAALGRKIILNKLTEEKAIRDGERLTAKVTHRLIDYYYYSDDIEAVLENEYHVSMYCDVIVCTIKLPSIEVLGLLAKGISDYNEKTQMWGIINLIRRYCLKIKNKNPDLILAVVPEFNRMIYLNSNGAINHKMDDLNPICDTLCMFVKNTPEGRALVEQMKQSPQSLTDFTKESSNS